MAESDQPLTREEVAHVAKLALLDLSDEEIDLFTVQLGDVIATAQAMNELDLGNIAPTHHPLGLTNVLRPDEVRRSLDRAEVLDQAPAVEDDRFRVPPALGED
jgi:aspartyl-tRNA(Asn)/glutamyl-tRNA(Gln) amidotransferase subunit C